MARYVVEMFGRPYEITGLRKVELELKNGASLADIVAGLKLAVPELEGEVIRTGEDRITDEFTFNINGRFYSYDGDLHLQEGDHIVLLTLATIG
jgi:molybdopterin converting factor small subunit